MAWLSYIADKNDPWSKDVAIIVNRHARSARNSSLPVDKATRFAQLGRSNARYGYLLERYLASLR